VPLLFGCDSHQIADEGKMAYSDYDAKSLKNRLKCLLPLPNFIVARPTLHDKLRDTHVFGAPSVSMILNLGSGVQNRLPGLINLDIYPHENTDVAGDAHRLPFLAESMDGVWLCAVMEHLRRPFDVADEVFRVLKPDGFVLVTVPFIQPRHGSPYDYFRYTLDVGLGCQVEGQKVIISKKQRPFFEITFSDCSSTPQIQNEWISRSYNRCEDAKVIYWSWRADVGTDIGRLNWPNFSAPKLAFKICSQSPILCGFQPVSKVPKNG
jgi:SAM-dependent methyltransferase